MSAPSIIVTIIAAVWGALLEGISGLIFGGALGYAIGAYIHLSAEVSDIKRALKALKECFVSFLVVGILLLVIGYFSPLPPKRKINS